MKIRFSDYLEIFMKFLKKDLKILKSFLIFFISENQLNIWEIFDRRISSYPSLSLLHLDADEYLRDGNLI